MLDFAQFNLIEGAFWIVCALFALIAQKHIRTMPVMYWSLLSALFSLFGISDFIEAYYSINFLEPSGYWLFVWKGVCLAGLLACATYYAVIRFRK